MKQMSKKLIVYYSMDGNTKMIAKMIHEKTGADMVMLNTVIPFQTHAGWPGHTLQDIEAAAKGAQVRNGKQIQFSAQEFGKLVTPEKEVREWIETL